MLISNPVALFHVCGVRTKDLPTDDVLAPADALTV